MSALHAWGQPFIDDSDAQAALAEAHAIYDSPAPVATSELRTAHGDPLSDDQCRGIEAVVDWYKNRRHEQKVFKFLGPAGSGKTSIVNPLLGALGLKWMVEHETGREGDALAGALAGKAVDVLREKGIPGKTLHSQIYQSDADEVEAIKNAQKRVRDLVKLRETCQVWERAAADNELRKARDFLAVLTDPRFTPSTTDALQNCKLFIVDEGSMVLGKLRRDLESFGFPILVLGDDFQLPGIKNDKEDEGLPGAYTDEPCDFRLTDIHRQAAHNPILKLSKIIREGGLIPYGGMGDDVFITPEKPSAEELCWADQVVVGTNRVRYELNRSMKEARGFADRYPTGNGERMICVRNVKPANFNGARYFNGQPVDLYDVGTDGRWLSGIVTPAGRPKEIGHRLPLYTGHFDNAIKFDPDRVYHDYFDRLSLVELDWAWALTCHKAQGSEWDRVIVVNDGWGREMIEKRRWLYTAVTRAKSQLGIIMGWR